MKLYFSWLIVLVGCSEQFTSLDGISPETGGDSGSGGSAGLNWIDARTGGEASVPPDGGPSPGGSSASTGGSASGGTSSTSGGSDTGGLGAGDAGGSEAGSGGYAGSADSGGSATGGAPAAECESGETRCSELQPQVCIDGAWRDDGSSCATACLEGTCVECLPGSDVGCLDPTQPGACDVTGHLVPDGPACAGATPQCAGNECIECTAGNTSQYCPSCGVGTVPCCKSTFGDGCGCQTFNGCQ